MTTSEQLEHFNRFARNKLQAEASLTIDAIFAQWQEAREREEALQGIQRGLEDYRAGRVQPWREFYGDFAKKNGILVGK